MRKQENKRDRHGKKRSGKNNHRLSVGNRSSRHWIGWAVLAVIMIAGIGISLSLFNKETPQAVSPTPVAKLPEAVLPMNQETRPVEPIPPPAAPRLDIPDPEFDFGFVPQNAKISHVFWLHSAGTDTLKIVKVNPG